MFFYNTHIGLKEKIENLSEKHNISLFSKLNKEKNKNNFESLLTEANFGLFFDKIGTNLRYNSIVFKNSKTTPDFIFSMNSQDIIVEVFRVNESEDENTNIDQLLKTIIIKPEKICGENGTIINKVKKYGNLVQEDEYPFLICVYLDHVSGLDAYELNKCLYGSSVDNRIANRISGGSIPGPPSHDYADGLYYKDPLVRNSVSGILLRDPNQLYTYFHNFNSNNKLNIININYFLKMQYEYR